MLQRQGQGTQGLQGLLWLHPSWEGVLRGDSGGSEPGSMTLTASQSGRGWKGPPKAGLPREGHTGVCPGGFEGLQRWRLQHPEQPAPGLQHPSVKEAPPCFARPVLPSSALLAVSSSPPASCSQLFSSLVTFPFTSEALNFMKSSGLATCLSWLSFQGALTYTSACPSYSFLALRTFTSRNLPPWCSWDGEVSSAGCSLDTGLSSLSQQEGGPAVPPPEQACSFLQLRACSPAAVPRCFGSTAAQP